MLDVRSALRRAVETNRTRPAIVAEGVQLTFEEAWLRGCQLANALLAMDLEAGDKIAVLEDNCLEAWDFFLACAIGNFVRGPIRLLIAVLLTLAHLKFLLFAPHTLTQFHRFHLVEVAYYHHLLSQFLSMALSYPQLREVRSQELQRTILLGPCQQREQTPFAHKVDTKHHQNPL